MGSGISHVYHATRNGQPMANISYMNQRNQCQHIEDVGWISSAAQIASYSNSLACENAGGIDYMPYKSNQL